VAKQHIRDIVIIIIIKRMNVIATLWSIDFKVAEVTIAHYWETQPQKFNGTFH